MQKKKKRTFFVTIKEYNKDIRHFLIEFDKHEKVTPYNVEEKVIEAGIRKHNLEHIIAWSEIDD